MTSPRNRRIARFAIPVLTAGIFCFDCLTSREIVAWGLYFIPLLLSFYAGACFSPIKLAAIFSVLTVLGFYLSPPGSEPGMALINLTLGLGTLWGATIVVARLRRSERFLQSTLDALSAHISILDEQGTIVAVNSAWRRFARQTNFPTNDFGIGANCLSLCEMAAGGGVAEASAIAKGIRSVMAGQRPEFLLEYACHSPQEQRWFIARATRFDGDGPIRIVVAHENITERKQAEESLKQSEEHFRSLFDYAPAAKCIAALDGRFLRVNEAFCRLFGHTAMELAAMSFSDLKHPDDRVQSIEYLRGMLADDAESRGLDSRYVAKNGNIVWGRVVLRLLRDAKGQPLHFLVSIVDLTERKHAEFELRKLSRAVEQSPASIVITDLQGAIEYVNPKFCALTGYSFYEVRGKNPRLLKSGEMPAENYRHLWATITAGDEWRGEFHNRKKSGELYWEAVSISPIRDDLGGVTHFVAVKEDITERKRTEELLREKDHLLSESQRLGHVGSWFSAMTGRLTWSEETYRIYGVAPETFAPTLEALLGLIHPDDLTAVKDWHARCAAGEKLDDLEFRINRPDGTIRFIKKNGASVFDSQNRFLYMAGAVQDVTESKQAEAALKQQFALREKLAKLAANVPAMIYSFRLRPDGAVSFPYVSPTSEAFFGVRAEDLVFDVLSLLNQIHPEDRPNVDESISESARTMLPWRAEFRVRHLKKGLFWVEGQSTPEREADGSILWHGFMSDISERKRAEDALRESEAKFHQLADHITDVFWICSPDYNTMHYVSPGYELVWGRSTQNLYARPTEWVEAVVPEDREQVLAVFNTLRTDAPEVNVEYRIARPDGTLCWIHDRGFQVRDGAGKLIRLCGIASDITERKRIAQELAERKQNEERSRLALELEQKSSQIKSRFVSMVSHEFRTPLSVIKLAAELLDGYLDRMTDAQRAEQLAGIRGSVERMTQMMNDFLIHGRGSDKIIVLQPEWVDVERLCRKLIKEIPQYSGSPRTIECSIEPAMGAAWLDEKILRHILGNILSNAVKYSFEGQPVKLAAKRVGGSPQAEGGTGTTAEPCLEFIVSDSGIGIPAADFAKLYQTFHRAGNVGNRPGTGMGLAIVKQFVDLIGGRIRFESQEGKGTTFWVQIPLVSPASLAER